MLKGYFKLGERASYNESETLNLPKCYGYFIQRGLRAKATGEKRPPKKGEWYLSGAVIEAYRAKDNLDTSYHIAQLVKVEEKTIIVEVA